MCRDLIKTRHGVQTMTLNSYFSAVLIIIGSGILATVGLLVARRFVHFNKLQTSHEVSGYLFSGVATLYAVLIGLIVIDAMQFHQNAREITEKECSNLADVFLLAKRLSKAEKTRIRNLCKDYVDQVIDTEWQSMQCGHFCPVAQEQAVNLMKALIDCEPKNEVERDLYPQMVQEASQFWQNRQTRIEMAQRGVPAVEWATLIVGAFMTVLFTYFFGLENTWLQVVMTSMVAMLIAMVFTLYLLFAFPFSGDLAVQADEFKQVKTIFTGP
jgi:hypothetical protein